jgi:integrase/recombinase XerD
MSPLRRHMTEDMAVRNLSPATQRSYLHAVSKFSSHFGRLPDRLVSGGARLPGPFGVDRHFVAGAEPDGLRAAVLLRRHARAQRDPGAHPLRARAAQAAGGAADEVVRFLEAVPSLKTRAALMTAYAVAGGVRGSRPEDR